MKISGIFSRNKGSRTKSKNNESDRPVTCSNCGTHYSGNFCPHCGQSSKDFNRPFRILIYDFMGSMFAFDARFFKTMKAVIAAPGRFSANYIEGKRMSYMPPLQFYVFISFVFFLLLNIKTGSFISEATNKLSEIQADSTLVDSAKTAQQIKELTYTLKNEPDSLEKKITKHQKNKTSAINSIKLLQKTLIKQSKNPNNTPYKKRILQNAIRLMDYPEMFVSKTLRYLSWSMFLLMPVFAFWLWAFFHKTRKFFLGHLIFSLESLSATFLIFSVMLAVKLIFPHKTIAPENYLFWLVPLYIWLGLKKFYHRSAWNTTYKFILLSFIYFFTTMITASVVFILSIYI
ncbi:MAG: DUF3667 domain-containing protein [Bacteroidales bacterium]|nr:DUF3667 domain-containing protein [Bacteroidales bacterium]